MSVGKSQTLQPGRWAEPTRRLVEFLIERGPMESKDLVALLIPVVRPEKASRVYVQRQQTRRRKLGVKRDALPSLDEQVLRGSRFVARQTLHSAVRIGLVERKGSVLFVTQAAVDALR